MTEFHLRQWAKKDFAYRYLEEADMRIMDRRKLLELLKSFYVHFMGGRKGNRVLDLGCGDGILTHELLKTDDSISAMLIDGSEDMLNKARERLAAFENIRFLRASFQELLGAGVQLPEFNLVVSALAIHHLINSEKDSLFAYIYSRLSDGGCFVNIDIVLSPTEALAKWYLALWREWMIAKEAEFNIESNYEWVIKSCMEGEHYSRLDILNDQLSALKEAGFQDVDCFYKHGIFVVYGGRK